MAKVVIDGKEMEFPDGTLLFDACKDARGESLPHFCYHPDLPIAGVCRLCQVEVEGMPKLTIACNTTVRDGMVVNTRSEKVLKAHRQILEMHLINHPVDCPICDQAGECGLQDQYMKYGLYETNVCKDDKVTNPKAVVIGPHVILDKDRCVLCSRCVRFCRTVTKTGEMGIFNRGDKAEIGTAPGVDLDNAYSLNTVDSCPVGALTSRDFRFQKRVWMLKSTDSICPGCATGCNVRLDYEADTIYRIKPRYNEDVNRRWMCDYGRLEYKSVGAENRLKNPTIDRTEVTWPDYFSKIKALGKPGLVISSPFNSLEELTLGYLIAEEACNGNASSGSSELFTGESDDLLISADKTPNRTGAKWVGFNEHTTDMLIDLINSTEAPILIHGNDFSSDPRIIVALKTKKVIYLGTHKNEISDNATVTAPVSCWAEKEGTFVNAKDRVQQFNRAVARPIDALEDWRLLAELIKVWGLSEAPESMPAVRRIVSNRITKLNGFDMNSVKSNGAVPDAGGES
jgi:NADH-quinone oxidoreductase subunit G